MKIAAWNVNSLNVRLPQVLEYLAEHQLDVLALQETKCTDDKFPLADINAAGYHAIYTGQKTFNGVAILTRTPVKAEQSALPNFADDQKRFLTTTLNGIHIVNVYVPNGQSVDSDKYQYKLAWLQHLAAYCKKALTTHKRVVVLGDFNIAPEDRDVHDPKAWEGQVLVSEPERAAFRSLLDLGFLDSFRLFTEEGNHYSWWDYRQGAFRRNLGLRIDHILVSESLRESCQSSTIDVIVRKAERPSDHTVVRLELAVL